VRKNIGGTGSQISVSLGQITNQEVLQQLFRCNVKVGGVSDFARDNLE